MDHSFFTSVCAACSRWLDSYYSVALLYAGECQQFSPHADICCVQINSHYSHLITSLKLIPIMAGLSKCETVFLAIFFFFVVVLGFTWQVWVQCFKSRPGLLSGEINLITLFCVFTNWLCCVKMVACWKIAFILSLYFNFQT